MALVNTYPWRMVARLQVDCGVQSDTRISDLIQTPTETLVSPSLTLSVGVIIIICSWNEFLGEELRLRKAGHLPVTWLTCHMTHLSHDLPVTWPQVGKEGALPCLCIPNNHTYWGIYMPGVTRSELASSTDPGIEEERKDQAYTLRYWCQTLVESDKV